jgi:hypothetical protein
MYTEIAQGQLDLGPTGLVIEFLITVAVIAAGSWLLFKKRSSVFWKKTDYAYLIFTIIGGMAAAADLAISSWSKEIQENKIIVDETSNHLRDYVAIGADSCRSINAQRDARNAQRDDHIGGIIRPLEAKPFNSFEGYKKNLYGAEKLVGSPQFVDLSESDCTFLQHVSDAITSDTLRLMVFEAQSHQIDRESRKWSKDPIEVIASDIEEIGKYSDRADELETSLSSLKYLSLLKALSPVLLGLGVGIRLARTHFDVKTEQENQRRRATADNIESSHSRLPITDLSPPSAA